jgi:hypothetical protein
VGQRAGVGLGSCFGFLQVARQGCLGEFEQSFLSLRAGGKSVIADERIDEMEFGKFSFQFVSVASACAGTQPSIPCGSTRIRIQSSRESRTRNVNLSDGPAGSSLKGALTSGAE